MKRRVLAFLVAGALPLAASLLAACARATSPAPSARSTPTPQPVSAMVLPAPVYTLREGQIWRLERDGRTLRQVTHEKADVESYHVSPVDGALAYVAANSLIACGPLGEERRVLLAGAPLPAVSDALAACNHHAWVAHRIATPVWSPDGTRLAFVQNGLRELAPATGKVRTLHPNDTLEGEVSDRLVLAEVHSWSPDGRHLLATTYRYPLTSLYRQSIALKTLDGYLYALSDGLGYTAAWADDSETFYLARSTFGGADALLRCAAGTGHCTMVGQDVPARTAFFYAHPHVAGDGRVRVFTGTSGDTATPPEGFALYDLQPDGEGVRTLRREMLAIDTALWAPDGSGVLASTHAASGLLPADTLVWVPADGTPIMPLGITGCRSLGWAAAF